MAAGTDDDFRIGPCGGEIEGNDARAEQGYDLFMEGKSEGLAAFAGGKVLDAEQKLSQTYGGKIEGLSHLGIEPAQNLAIGPRLLQWVGLHKLFSEFCDGIR